ncbi:SMI1/KNR4 family protein [Gordonia polyisoprenivorans]|uniref:SMI1/KNR4 family protein n=1 Tax=Gordonia polyisoprenivorans TaxID=84595 RepID=UPI001AD64A0C|nr:SMI1/KNR4 family protein [Gordonia polyisoprenivorans]QTI71282.1 SMI1/KNR4 family protein [Gordonia polyisoprenivorans]
MTDLIHTQLELHQRLIDAGIYLHGPSALHPPATPGQIAAAEDRLGSELSPQHRELLMITNGWYEQHGFNSILSTEELGDPRIQPGMDLPISYQPDEPGTWAARMYYRNACFDLSEPADTQAELSLPANLDDWRQLYPIADGADSGGQILAHSNATTHPAIYSTCRRPPYQQFDDLIGYLNWCIADDQATLESC